MIPSRRRVHGLAIGVILALGAACVDAGSDEPDSRQGAVVIDDAGRRVARAVAVRRMVSLVPSVTELVLALGAGDRLVARTRYDTDPALAGLPSVGGGLDPSLERLVELAPDLVVVWNVRDDRTLRPRLVDEGIAVYAAAIEDTTGLFGTIERFGILLGREAAAARVARSLRDTLAAVARDAGGGRRPGVLYLIPGDPPRTAGPTSFIGQLVSVAGGRSPFPELEAPWPAVSLETVVARDPEVIVVPRGAGLPGPETFVERPGWRDLSAVRAGRIVTIDADLVARPGPHLGRAARVLATRIAAAVDESEMERPDGS